MPTDSPQYFDDSYRQIANDGCQRCAVTEDYLSKCKDCGLDVAQQQEDNDRQKAFFMAFKRNFFPNMD